MRTRKTDDATILSLLKKGLNQKQISKHFGVSPVAICKRLKRLQSQEPPESLKKLSDKKQKFCLKMAEGKTSTQSALESFECSSRDSAKVIGSQLKNDPDVKTAMADIFAQEGKPRRYRVRRLGQHIDHPDPNISLKALDQAGRMSGDFMPEKIEIEVTPNYKLINELNLLISKLEEVQNEKNTINVTPEKN